MALQLSKRLLTTALLLVALAACGSGAPALASDPPGALVRLQRNDGVATLPGDLTIFSGGSLQLYLGERGALRKNVDPAELASLQSALSDPGLAGLAATYPATLPSGAGDTLTIYGAQRRVVRYNPNAPDLPPALQRLISEVMRLRQRF
jgi:hypothetical protein